jgi:hypothetical protein
MAFESMLEEEKEEEDDHTKEEDDLSLSRAERESKAGYF